MEIITLGVIIGLLFSLTFNSKSLNNRRRGWVAKTYIRTYGLIGLGVCYFSMWIGLFILLLAYHIYKNAHGEKDSYVLYTNEFLMYVATYFALSYLIKEWMINYILWSLVIIGLILSWITYYSYNLRKEKSSIVLSYMVWEIYEPGTIAPRAGLGNINIAQIVISICIAAVCGLMLQGQIQAGLALLGLWYPLYRCRDNTKKVKETGPEQGWLYIGILVVSIVMLYNLWIGLWILSIGLATFIYLFKNKSSGRLEIWKKLLQSWSKDTWKVKLLGSGVVSFRQQANKIKCGWSHAHNEYLETLIEYGLVGLLLLVGFIGTLLYKSYNHNQSLFLVLVMICSSAMLYFPWKAYKEDFLRQGIKMGFGSQLLLVLSIVIAACVK